MAIIEVSHLQKRYGMTTAVEDVSFSVAEGEIFGLLGPNGAGKTTTVECIVGLRVPDAGEIRILGLNPQVDGAALHERVGVQLQESALPPKLRVGEALSLYASFYSEPDDSSQLLESLGLSEKSNDYFRDLSGGQKQRLSIALALVGHPTIAVLDELTTGLDPRARRETWSLIEALRDRGVTVLLVTHDMDEAQHLCDRVALIDAGRVVAIDSPAALAEKSAGGKRVHFRPSGDFDEAVLLRLPEVRKLSREGDWVVATGEGELVNAVILGLEKAGVEARDVKTDAGALEEAFLALVDHSDEDPSPAPARGRSRDERPLRERWAIKRRASHGSSSVPRTAFTRLVASEWRLAVRNPVGLVWGVGFPLLLLVIFGSIPATNTPVAGLGGLTFFEVYVPVIIAMSLALIALYGVPIPLVSYRELGVLRRMATTPIPPSWLLGAQVVINLAMLICAVAVVALGGGLVFRAHLDVQIIGLALSMVFAVASMFSIGLWVASVAKNQRAAAAISAVLFYPMAFFAGVWLPRESMPTALRTMSDVTPLGSAVHGFDYSMLIGRFPPWDAFAVMAGWTLVIGWLAVRLFRWE